MNKILSGVCRILLLVILLGLLIGCQRAPTVAPYHNAEYGFSLNYPADWGVLEREVRSEFQVIFTPLDASPDNDIFLMFIPGEYSPTYDPNKFCQQIKKWQTGVRSIEDVIIGGLPAKKFIIIIDGKPKPKRGGWITSLDPMHPFDILYYSPLENFNNYCGDFDLMIDTLEFTGLEGLDTQSGTAKKVR